jgi:putative heme d1 biosynthesis radical SAM protein NirJ2
MIISWNITKRCNLYCKHCYRDSSSEYFSGELNTNEGKKLIDQIASAGFKILILSGGEPLMREDLCILASHAKEKGLIPVLGTNGTLITENRAKELKESGIMAAGVSIDFLDPKKHDEFRNVQGSFQKTIEGIENCLKAGIRVQINTTVTKDNKDEILDITDFAKKIGATSHHPFFLVEVGRGKNLKKEALEKHQYIEMINTILNKQLEIDIELKPTCAPQFMSLAKKRDMKMRFSRGCLAGISYCCILPNGDVHICPYLPIKVGNIRQVDFDKIWKENKIFNDLRDFEKYKGKCGSCKDISVCGGCRARAFITTGDYLEEDPVCTICYTETGGD